MKNLKYLYIIGTAISISWMGCSSKDAKKIPPSVIENPVKESDLTTVKLTEKAVERLGIKSKGIEERPSNTLAGRFAVFLDETIRE